MLRDVGLTRHVDGQQVTSQVTTKELFELLTPTYSPESVKWLIWAVSALEQPRVNLTAEGEITLGGKLSPATQPEDC